MVDLAGLEPATRRLTFDVVLPAFAVSWFLVCATASLLEREKAGATSIGETTALKLRSGGGIRTRISPQDGSHGALYSSGLACGM